MASTPLLRSVVARCGSIRSAGQGRRKRVAGAGAAIGMLAVGCGLVGATGALASTPGPVVASTESSCGGGWTVTAHGAVTAFGGEVSYGSAASGLSSPVTAITATTNGDGYWLVTRSGSVLPFGDATSHGSLSLPATTPGVVAIASTRDSRGYWLATSAGRVYSFGDAHWLGSSYHLHLRSPVVSMAAIPDGAGYYLATTSGHVFNYGRARWFGSAYSRHLSHSIVSLAVTDDGRGYWEADMAGQVFSFGEAATYGSAHLGRNAHVVTMATNERSYRLVLGSGRMYAFGAANSSCGITVPPTASTTTVPPTTSTTTASSTTTTSLPPTTTPTTTAPPTTSANTVPPTTSTTVPPTTSTTEPPATTPGTPPSSSLSFGQFAQPLSDVTTADGNLGSSGFVNDFVTNYETDYGAVGVNEMPLWTVPSGQATVTMTAASGCNNGFLADTGSEIPIPSGVTASGSVPGDSPLVIDQPSTHTEWEFWQAHPVGGGAWEACWGGRLDTATSDGVFPSPYGLSASGISYLATTITEADVASGSIDHAIALNMPGCTAPEVAPADRTDCSSGTGGPPYGTIFRFPAGMAMPSGLTPFGQMVFRAIQTYGMVYMDQGGAVMVYSESTSDWAAQGHSGIDPITASWDGEQEYQVIANLPWSHLQVVAAL